MKRDSPWSI